MGGNVVLLHKGAQVRLVCLVAEAQEKRLIKLVFFTQVGAQITAK